jgi:SpoU rRNA methylase family enzyme
MRNKTIVIFLFITFLALTISLTQVFVVSACRGRDRKPPKIHYVYQYPAEPEYEDSVLVLAYITDCKSGVANATLHYRVNGQESVTLKMNKSGNLYFAEIPQEPYNSTVAYVICAYDKAGNKACSKEYAYAVGDFHPPTITYIERVPAQPNYNETVLIVANVVEPPLASGVKEMLLSYSNGTGWIVTKMDFNGTFYTAMIPAFPYETTIRYRVSAVDNAGNTVTLDVYSYAVTDRFPPIATILAPNDGSYIAGNINITIYVQDDNLLTAKLTVDETLLAEWNATGQYVCPLDTVAMDEGLHVLTLEAIDKAGNTAKHTIVVTVDNTSPMAEILSPPNGSYLHGTVLIKLQAEDTNFDRMELKIGEEEVRAWETKDQIYVWDTKGYSDGTYNITLTVFDKAGNKAESTITVMVDNTVPVIGDVSWTPTEPKENETVKVFVATVEDGSGIKNVTLWFRQLGGEWQNMPMIFENGNWTCTIPGYDENAIITFYVECFDKAGNSAITTENYYIVKAAGEGGVTPAAEGFPLYWLILIILVVFAVLASTAYYIRKRKRASATTNYFAITSL